MKEPIITTPKGVGKPNLGGISNEVWIATLRDQVAALRKELDQAKKDMTAMRKTIQSQSEAIGDLSKNFSAKLKAIESKAGAVAAHVHDYVVPSILVFDVPLPDGGMASKVETQPAVVQTFGPKQV